MLHLELSSSGSQFGPEVRRGSSVAGLSRLRRQLDDRQELKADRHAQKVDQISRELGGFETLLIYRRLA